MDIKLVLTMARAAAADDRPAPASLAEWRADMHIGEDTVMAAFREGLRAGQLAFAFAGGYQSALRRLLPSLAPAAFAALLLSEGRRQRPDELQTSLTCVPGGDYVLAGEKSYVMGGADADELLVIARCDGEHDDGRVRTAMLLVPARSPGVRHTARTEAVILPALPHGRVAFDGVIVPADRVLPGDGWTQYARPFRTHEDIHVSIAVTAHLLVHALRRDFPRALVASLLANIVRLGDCARHAVEDPAAHLLLAAAEQELLQCGLQVSERLRDSDDAFARDWRANQMVVALAAPARQRRLEKAFSKFLT